MPQEVRVATAAYREEKDLFGGFFEECCVAKPSATITSKELYAAYLAWAASLPSYQ